MLVDVTVRVAWQLIEGKATVAGAVSAPVAALVDGVVRAMWMTKMKVVAASVLAIGILGTGVGLIGHQVWADKPVLPAPERRPRFLAQLTDSSPDDREKLQGRWRVTAFERGGKPDGTRQCARGPSNRKLPR